MGVTLKKLWAWRDFDSIDGLDGVQRIDATLFAERNPLRLQSLKDYFSSVLGNISLDHGLSRHPYATALRSLIRSLNARTLGDPEASPMVKVSLEIELYELIEIHRELGDPKGVVADKMIELLNQLVPERDRAGPDLP